MRNGLEHLFNHIEHFHRLFMCGDKRASRSLLFVSLVLYV